MCCFNRPIEHVASTRILVTPTRHGRQITVYENSVGKVEKKDRGLKGFYRDESGRVVMGVEPEELKQKRLLEEEKKKKENAKNAMILPAPLKKGQKIELLDLSATNAFSFASLDAWFPKVISHVPQKLGGSIQKMAMRGHLEVHSVGNYFISIAENFEDLQRIDPDVFVVSDEIKNLFEKHYTDGYGFVICSFDPNKPMQAHPIGYIHDLLDNGDLFVPTRHQHTFDVKEEEHFDHTIYSVNTTSQGGAGPSAEEIERSNYEKMKTLGDFVPRKSAPAAMKAALEAAGGPLSEQYPTEIKSVRCRKIKGLHKNADFIFSQA